MPTLLTSLLARFPIGKFGAALAVAAMLVVGPLLAFSETTLKGIMDRWLSQCTVVIDVNQDDTEAPIVRLHSFGEMPESIPLTFAAGKGLIERVSLLNHVEQDTTPSESNILVHPLANQRCPGDLCPDTSEPSEKLTIRIRPVSPNYVYQFRVLLGDRDPQRQLKAYVKPLLDEKVECRVETTTVSNFVARQTRGVQILIFFVGVIFLSLALGFFRRRTGASS